MKPHSRHPAAFTITEMLGVILLFVVFLFVSAHLFTSVMKMNYNTTQADNERARFDSLVRVLRADVWGASDMNVDDGSLTLKSPAAVQWKVDDQGAVLRSEKRDGKQHVMRWETGLKGVALRVENEAVMLSVPPRKGAPGGEVRMVSQLKLLGRVAS